MNQFQILVYVNNLYNIKECNDQITGCLQCKYEPSASSFLCLECIGGYTPKMVGGTITQCLPNCSPFDTYRNVPPKSITSDCQCKTKIIFDRDIMDE